MKTIEAEYIESGTFQGCEEDAFTAGIKSGETCVVMSKKGYRVISDEHNAQKADALAARHKAEAATRIMNEADKKRASREKVIEAIREVCSHYADGSPDAAPRDWFANMILGIIERDWK